VSPEPQSSRPSLFSIEGRAKWDAWHSAGVTWKGKEAEAEERYKEIAKGLGWSPGVVQDLTDFKEPTAAELLEGDDDNVDQASKPGGGSLGTAVSAMERPPPVHEDEGTLHGYAISDDLKGLMSFLEAHPDTNLNQLDQYGYTALHLGCDRGSLAVVRFLLSHGADSSIVDADGFSALDLARETGDDEIIALLKAPGS